jgi:hypothetical protein
MKINLFHVSGTVVQKAEWRTEIRSEGGISKRYEAHNILSTRLSCSNQPQFQS